MLVVNNPGSWKNIYPHLQHARWHGMTLADLVFPFFLFAAGASVHFLLQRQRSAGLSAARIAARVGLRAALLILLGLTLNAIPDFDLSTLRVPGVLQRIGLVVFAAALAALLLDLRGVVLLALLICILHTMALLLIPAPGFGAPNLLPEHNLSGWIDQQVFGAHLWRWTVHYDPEGLLSTFPALSVTLFGLVFAALRDRGWRLRQLAGLSFFVCLLGGALSLLIPLNKQLWTASFAALSGGLAGFALLALSQFGDWSGAWLVAPGRNALALFALSSIVTRLLTRFPSRESSFQSIAYQWLLSASGDSDLRLLSLSWALLYTGLFWLLAMALHRKKLYLRL